MPTYSASQLEQFAETKLKEMQAELIENDSNLSQWLDRLLSEESSKVCFKYIDTDIKKAGLLLVNTIQKCLDKNDDMLVIVIDHANDPSQRNFISPSLSNKYATNFDGADEDETIAMATFDKDFYQELTNDSGLWSTDRLMNAVDFLFDNPLLTCLSSVLIKRAFEHLRMLKSGEELRHKLQMPYFHTFSSEAVMRATAASVGQIMYADKLNKRLYEETQAVKAFESGMTNESMLGPKTPVTNALRDYCGPNATHFTISMLDTIDPNDCRVQVKMNELCAALTSRSEEPKEEEQEEKL